MDAVIEPHRWTSEEYAHMVRSGVFGPSQHVELIEGEVIDMVPQNESHAVALSLIDNVLRGIFTTGFVIPPQSPLALGASSQPEPDLAVVEGAPRDFIKSHPRSAVLVVEISDSSLNHDRTSKLNLYARHGIPCFWIVNLVDGVLETYGNPVLDSYQAKLVLRRGDTVRVGPSQIVLNVEELLP
jgi:Uma2 family endonuclease